MARATEPVVGLHSEGEQVLEKKELHGGFELRVLVELEGQWYKAIDLQGKHGGGGDMQVVVGEA